MTRAARVWLRCRSRLRGGRSPLTGSPPARSISWLTEPFPAHSRGRRPAIPFTVSEREPARLQWRRSVHRHRAPAFRRRPTTTERVVAQADVAARLPIVLLYEPEFAVHSLNAAEVLAQAITANTAPGVNQRQLGGRTLGAM